MTWTSAQLRRLSLWLICVMLLAALAPTVSRARAWSQGSAVPWMEVCTTNGTQRVAVSTSTDVQTDEAPKPGHAMLDHCAMCVLASERMVPPPPLFAWLAQPQAPPLLVPWVQFVPQAVLHWTVHSRAPPAHA
jgi:hypothetical protein